MTLSAAVSVVLRPNLTGPPSPHRVLATFPRAVYLQAETPAEPPGLIALVTSDGVVHPNAAVVAADAGSRPLGHFHVGARVMVGHGRIEARETTITVSRWWSAEPAIPACSPATLARTTATLQDRLARGALPPRRLTDAAAAVAGAARAGRTRATVSAGRQLLGWGPGLTPSGDDVLCGLFVAAQVLTRALGAAEPGGSAPSSVASTLQQAATELVMRARHTTTALSYALLWHAARGHVAGPVAAVVRALAGHGTVEERLPGLLAVGSTSGRDLAIGLVAGARLALDARPPNSHSDVLQPVLTGGPR